MKSRIIISTALASILLVITIVICMSFKTNEEVSTVLFKEKDKGYIILSNSQAEKVHKGMTLPGDIDEHNVILKISDIREIEDTDFTKVYISSSEKVDGEKISFSFQGETWGKYILHKVI